MRWEVGSAIYWSLDIGDGGGIRDRWSWSKRALLEGEVG